MSDDILGAARSRRRRDPVVIAASAGLWVEHVGSGFVGVIETYEHRAVGVRDDSGLLRVFPLEPGAFRQVANGAIVTLAPPTVGTDRAGPRLTKAGAISTGPSRARVAVGHRILVEGIHDAELLEKVWGEELRAEALAVEPIDGADNLAAELVARQPGPQRRVGVLLDHLVPGSKESRIAAAVRDEHVLIQGHPYVDVWQAVRPHVVGLQAWPVIERGQSWKDGITAALGGTEPPLMWRRILGRVDSFRDLEPSFVGAVERLLDFLCAPPDAQE